MIKKRTRVDIQKIAHLRREQKKADKQQYLNIK